MNEKSRHLGGVALTSLSALLYATMPLFTNLSYRCGINVETFNLYKSVWALPVLAVALLVRRKSVLLPPKQMLCAIAAGVLCKGVTSQLLYSSYQYVSSGVATTLHFMYPLFAALVGRLFFREALPGYKWLALLLAQVAAALLVDLSAGGNGVLGIVLAALSGLVYACYIQMVDKTGLSRIDPLVFSFYLAASGAAFSLVYGLASGRLQTEVSVDAHAWAAVVAVLTSVVASSCFQQGIKRLGGTSAAFFSLLEPAGSCVLGAMLLNERLGLRSVLGILLILFSVLAMVWMDDRRQRRAVANHAN